MPVAIFVMLSMALHAKALDYDTRYYNQTLDHLHAGSHENYAKWSHRYLINDDFWGEDGGLSSRCVLEVSGMSYKLKIPLVPACRTTTTHLIPNFPT